jgi:DNA-binding FrmR family transcriptional regulator
MLSYALLMRTTELEADALESIQKRLRRIEGQVRGLQKMCDQGRPCEEVLTQMNATIRAMESAATTVLKEYLHSVADDFARGQEHDAEEIATMLRKFA